MSESEYYQMQKSDPEKSKPRRETSSKAHDLEVRMFWPVISCRPA